jgi:hypothetical protein
MTAAKIHSHRMHPKICSNSSPALRAVDWGNYGHIDPHHLLKRSPETPHAKTGQLLFAAPAPEIALRHAT